MLQDAEFINKVMKTDIFPEKKPTMLNNALNLDTDPAAVHLNQSDIAKLFGITRQRVCQLVSRGLISTQANGKINPSQAAKELLKLDPTAARAKVLVNIRRQIEAAESRASEAETARDEAESMAKAQDRATGALIRQALEYQFALERAHENILDLAESFGTMPVDEIDAVFDLAMTAAMTASLGELSEKGDPDLVALLPDTVSRTDAGDCDPAS